MIILFSPSKRLNPTKFKYDLPLTEPYFKNETINLAEFLSQKTVNELKNILEISEKLAEEVKTYYTNFARKLETESYPAIMLFKGDCYRDLEINNYSQSQFEFINRHLRIISGLYGFIKPLDKITYYRLPMGTKLIYKNFQNLYKLWEDNLTKQLGKDIIQEKANFIINLASNEYASVINQNKLSINFVNVKFMQISDNIPKIIGIYAKRARSRMLNYIIKNEFTGLDEIKNFSEDGYKFMPDISHENELIFHKTLI